MKDRVCLRELNVDGKAVLNFISYKPYMDAWSGFNFSKIWGYLLVFMKRIVQNTIFDFPETEIYLQSG